MESKIETTRDEKSTETKAVMENESQPDVDYSLLYKLRDKIKGLVTQGKASGPDELE